MSQHFVINAGRKKIGDVGYDNYVGQIKPADMAKIIWFGVGGDDTTGDGSLANPYLTFARGTDDLSATKIYVLNIDLGGTREMSSLIYWNPATGNDANTGLTPAQAVQSYAVAKAKAILNNKTTIEALTSFTMTDLLDFPTQGELGEVLNYDVLPNLSGVSATVKTESGEFISDIAQNPVSGIIIAISDSSTTLKIYRSNDFGQSWVSVSNPWSLAGSPRGIAYANGIWLICGDGASVGRVLRSTDDGLTWVENSVTGRFYDVIWSGVNFIICGKDSTGVTTNYIKTSPDGITWTDRTDAFGNPATTQLIKMATDKNGTVMIVGYDGAAGKMQLSSDHGATWTDYSGILTGSGKVKQVAYGNGIWLIRRAAGVVRFHTSVSPSVTWTAGPSGLQEMDSGDPFGASISYSPILNSFLYADPAYPGVFAITPSSYSLISVMASDQKYFFAISILVSGAEYAFCGGFDSSSNGLIDITPIYPTNIRANVCNIIIDTGSDLRLGLSNDAANITVQPTTGQAAYLYERFGLKAAYILSVNAIAATCDAWAMSVSKSIVISPTTALQITGTAAAQDDIKVLRNTIAGNFSLLNTGGTNKELIQDNIITGDAVATAVTDMKSGDVLGAVSNFNLLPSVAEIDPLFIDSVEYKIQRELLGAIFDSYMIQRSAFYINGNGDAADWGAWSSFAINIQYIFTRSFNFLLPSKPDTVAQVKHNRANLKVSENGTPDVVNTPTGRWEEIVLSYGALPQLADYLANHIEFVDWMESLIDMTCEIAMDANYAPATTVTASAASAIDDPFIDIVAANIRSGDRIVVASKEYSVIYVINGTRLVLSEPLKSAVSISQSIRVKSPVGYGEYQYVPQQERKLSQWMFNRKDYIRGLQLRFVRKWQ